MVNREHAWRLVMASVAAVVALAAYTAFLGPHSASKLQAKLQVEADEALTSANLTTWRAEAKGAAIELEGAAPSEEARRQAIETIRSATGVMAIWADEVVVAPYADPFEWTAKKESGRVLLAGHAPNRTALNAIHEAARKLYGSDMQDEALLASGAPEGVEWDVAAIKGLEALVKLQRGTAVLRDGQLTVTGIAGSDADARSILSWLHGEKGGAKIITNIVGPAEWYARAENGLISLQGKAPSDSAHDDLVRAAGSARIAEDKIYIGGSGGWQARAKAALPLLAQFEHGELAVQGKVFRISGDAPGSVLGYLREDMARIADGYTVEYDVTQAEPDMPELRGLGLGLGLGNGHKASADACQTALNRIGNAYKISFGNSRALMDRSSGRALDRLVAVLGACPQGKVEIQGHTDATGSRIRNIALSRDRAEAVKDYLVQRGVSAERLSAVGFGPDKPVASNRTDGGRARNRRIEFRVLRGE